MEHFHGQQIMINSDSALLKNRRHFELRRCHFIVAGLDGDTDLVEFEFSLAHAGQNTRRDAPKVMVFELLMLGGNGADESTAANFEIWAEAGMGQE